MDGLRSHGYIAGQNLIVQNRLPEVEFDRSASAHERDSSVAAGCYFCVDHTGSAGCQIATKAVPIVFASVADPLGVGLVGSCPTQEATSPDHQYRRGARGKEAGIAEGIGAHGREGCRSYKLQDQNSSLQMNSAQAAADKLRIELGPVVAVQNAADLKSGFEAAGRMKAAAALRMLDPQATALRGQTIQYAAEYRIPVMYPFREDVAAGGLISYGPSLPDQYRQAARFVDIDFEGIKA